MKKLLFVFVTVLLIIAGCSAGVRKTVDADPRVRSFVQLFPEAEYGETSFSGGQALTLNDIIRQDCGAVAIPGSFVRATYVVKAATLVAYVGNGSLFCVASKLNQEAFIITKGDPADVANGTLIAVNGELITLQQVQVLATQLTPEVRNQTTVGVLVNQLVDQVLLRQAAEDVMVNDSDVAIAAERAWRTGGFASQQDFENALQQQGGTYGIFLESVRDQLKVQRMLDEKGITAVNISADDASQYYLNNPNSFLVSEQVDFRQLFIGFNESGGTEQAQARLQTVLDKIRGGAAFCDLIRVHSDDTTSRDRCGEYVSPRGVLLPELEAAIFSLGVNQSTVVESKNGYHVVVVLAHQPTAVLPYAQAEQQVLGMLRNTAIQQRLSIYLLKLRADAAIVDYTQG